LGEVVTQDELILRRAEWKRNGRRVVFASGAFDLLHPGHVRLLEQARSLGDVLVVAIASEAVLRASHGAARPVTPAAERAEILAALAAVDCVVELDAPSPRELIKRLLPDVIVERATSSGEAGCTDTPTGATLVRIPPEPGYSTAALLQRIKEPGQPHQRRQPNA